MKIVIRLVKSPSIPMRLSTQLCGFNKVCNRLTDLQFLFFLFYNITMLSSLAVRIQME
jgi:hypothetical protein